MYVEQAIPISGGFTVKNTGANNRTETIPAIALRLPSGTTWRGVVYPRRYVLRISRL